MLRTRRRRLTTYNNTTTRGDKEFGGGLSGPGAGPGEVAAVTK